MSEAAHETPPEFWQPPSPAAAKGLSLQAVSARPISTQSVPTMAEVCPRCHTEFLLKSHFCHTCGGRRPLALSPTARADAAAIAGLWEQLVARVEAVLSRFSWRRVRTPSWLHYLHFHEIKDRVGLSTASLIAFIIGLGCVTAALAVGLLTASNFVDWQAI